jgi:predicted phosphodiesterase
VPLGLVSDIHGNDRALASVAAELAPRGIDELVCLGDAVQGGDEPREVLDRLESLGWPVILGDADGFLLEVPADSPEPLTPQHLEKREWTLAQLDERHLDRIRAFPRTLRVGRLLAFHGSPRSYDDVLLPDSEDDAAWHVAGLDVLAGGHTHLQWARLVGGALYVNPGAVMSEPAEFAVVAGRSVEFCRCAY